MTDTKLYIFTIPKAGTYFLAELMSRLGWVDSGLHIAEDHYLDTKRQPMAIAASHTLSTEHQRPYYQSLEQVRAGQLCFGHMNPMLFFRPHQGDFAVLGCRRRLRDVLAAEFVDFRYRRVDPRLSWISRDAIAADGDAFVEYLRRNGPAIADIAATYLAYRELRSAHYYNDTRDIGRYVDLAFEHLMGPHPLAEMRRLARAFGLTRSDEELLAVLQQAKAAENKTKTTGQAIQVDRAGLWAHPEAQALYEKLGLRQLSVRLGYAQ